MSTTLAQKLFHSVKSNVVGFAFSKHFWERYVERFNHDLSPLEGLINKIDNCLIELMFDAASNMRYNQTIVKHNDVHIPLVLNLSGKHPVLTATTIFKPHKRIHHGN